MDRVLIGAVSCDFMGAAEFYSLCESWLDSYSFHHVVTLNSEMVVLAERDSSFRKVVGQADIRTPDSFGMWCAEAYLRAPNGKTLQRLWRTIMQPPTRISGVDMIVPLCHQAQTRDLPIYLLGGTQEEVRGAAQLLRRAIPGVAIYTSQDHPFTLTGPSEIVADIQRVQPGLLFVAYGAPKQTEWIEAHREALKSVRIAVGVGGAFRMLSGKSPRAPVWIRNRFEWLWRLFWQPHRAIRITRAVLIFPWLVFRHKKRGKVVVDPS